MHGLVCRKSSTIASIFRLVFLDQTIPQEFSNLYTRFVQGIYNVVATQKIRVIPLINGMENLLIFLMDFSFLCLSYQLREKLCQSNREIKHYFILLGSEISSFELVRFLRRNDNVFRGGVNSLSHLQFISQVFSKYF